MIDKIVTIMMVVMLCVTLTIIFQKDVKLFLRKNQNLDIYKPPSSIRKFKNKEEPA